MDAENLVTLITETGILRDVSPALEETMMATPILASSLLLRLSKHAALLVCLLILGRVSGRYGISSASLLYLAVLSALLHMMGRALQVRFVLKIFRNGFR